MEDGSAEVEVDDGKLMGSATVEVKDGDGGATGEVEATGALRARWKQW